MSNSSKADLLQQIVNRRKATLEQISSMPSTPPATTQTQEDYEAALKGIETRQNAMAQANDSWTDMGELDTAWGAAKQAAAHFAETGLGRLTSEVANAPDNISRIKKTSNIKDEAQNAYLKEKAFNEANAEYLKLGSVFADDPFAREKRESELTQIMGQNRLTKDEAEILEYRRPGVRNMYTGETSVEPTQREIIRERDEHLADADQRSKAITGWFDELNFENELDTSQEEAMAALGATADKYAESNARLAQATKDGDLWAMAKELPSTAAMIGEGVVDLVNNPSGVLQTVSESLPSTALAAVPVVGTAAMVGANLAYGLDTDRKAQAKFIQENGRMPTREEAGEMALWNIGAGLLESVADKVMVGTKAAGSYAANAGKKTQASRKAAGATEEGSSTQSMAAKLLGLPIKAVKPVTPLVGKAATEGTTEYIQTLIENDLGVLDYDPTTWEGKDAFTAGMMGVAGGVVSPVIVGGTTGAAKAAMNAPQTIADAATSAKTAVQEQVSNNREQKAQEAQLKQAVESGDLSTVVDPQQKGFDLYNALNTIRLRNSTDGVETSEKIANAEIASNLINTASEQADALADKLRAMTKDGIQTSSQDYQDTYAEFVETTDKLSTAQAVVDQINAGNTSNTQDADTLVETVANTSERSNEFTAAAQQLIKILTVSDSAITIKQAEQVARSSSLTESERTQIDAYMAARQAEDAFKSLSEVRQNVLYGGRGYIGLRQYRSAAMTALDKGNITEAISQQKKLAKFASQHMQKAKDYSLAVAPYLRAGRGQEIQPTEEEQAAIDRVSTLYTQVNGEPVYVSGGLRRTAEAITHEANLLQAGLAEVDAFINARTGTPTAAPVDEAQGTSAPAKGSTTIRPNTSRPVEVRPAEASVEAQTENTIEEMDIPAYTEDTALSDDMDSYFDETVAQPEPVEPQSTAQVAKPSAPVVEETDSRDEARFDLRNLQEGIKQIDISINEPKGLYRKAADELGIDPNTEDQGEIASIQALETTLREALTKDRERKVDLAQKIREDLDAVDNLDNTDTLAKRLTTQTEANKQAVEEAPDSDKQFVVNRVQTQFQPRNVGKSIKNILQQVPDLISRLKKDPDVVKSYVPDADAYTGQHREIVLAFAAMAEQQSETIDRLFKPMTKRKHINYMQYLTDEEGKLLPEAKTAISAAIFDWITGQANELFIHDNEAINSILNLSKETTVLPELAALMRKAGMPRNELIRALGKQSARTLGIVSKDTGPGNAQTRLEQAMGTLAVSVMLSDNMLYAQDIDFNEVSKWLLHNQRNGDGFMDDVAIEVIDFGNNATFVRPNFGKYKDDDGFDRITQLGYAGELNDVTRGANDFVASLFDTESEHVFPSLKAPKSVNDTRKGTDQKISAKEKRTLEKHQKREHLLAADTDAVFNLLDRDQMLQVAGVKADYLTTRPKMEHAGIEGKNATLERELDNYLAFRERLQQGVGALATPFFFRHQVWKQGRIGMLGSLVNPQASKLHRGLITMKEWLRTVDASNTDHMDFLRLGVAQSLDVDIDKLRLTESLAQLAEKLKDPVIQKGLGEIRKALAGKEADTKAIVAAVQKGKHNTHTLRGLTNYARYLNAKAEAKGQPFTFDTDMVVEIDGITNGVAIGALLFSSHDDHPTALKDLMARSGMFQDPNMTYGTLMASGVSDNYRTFGKEWAKGVKKHIDNLKAKGDVVKIARVNAITRYLNPEERSNSKLPLMTTVYGASLGGVVYGVVGDFLGKVYDHMAKIEVEYANDPQAKAEAYARLSADLSIIADDKITVTGLDFEITPATAQKLYSAVYRDLGIPLGQAIDAEYQSFMSNRDKFNEAMRYSSAIYKAVLNKKVKAKTAEMLAAGELQKGDTLPKADVRKIKESLREIMPINTTLHSDDLAEGIFVGKQQMTTATEGSEYLVQFQFNGTLDFRKWDQGRKQWEDASKAMVDQLRSSAPIDMSYNSYAIPLINSYGETVDYHYEMNKVNRENLLKQNNRVADVLGAQRASIIDKVNSADLNAKVVKSLHAQYQHEHSLNPSQYIAVGPNSDDPHIKEIWSVLPKETKQLINRTWGTETMQVRKDLLDLVFGYRKASITNAWNTPKAQRTYAENALIMVADHFLGGIKGARTAERVWQEIIRGVKDILVIKSVVTLVGNVVSNLWLLGWSGMGPVEAVKSTAEGWVAALDYQKQNKRLFKLETELAMNPGSSRLQAQIRDAKLELSRNPVKELVEAGMFQTIIEDVDQMDDPFSYKTQLTEWVDAKTERVPSWVKSAGSVLTVSHDTGLYRFLAQSTQISDFAARYAKFKHLTQKKGMPKTEALDIVMEDFIYYDVPTHRGVQYMNDIGLIMFSKYFLRIQKPLLRLFRENPTRSVAMVIGHNMFDLTTPLDYAMGIEKSPFDLFYNPASAAVGSLDEALPISLIIDAIR
jgi:hypothetical protein